jgi:hypothetical protein
VRALGQEGHVSGLGEWGPIVHAPRRWSGRATVSLMFAGAHARA